MRITQTSRRHFLLKDAPPAAAIRDSTIWVIAIFVAATFRFEFDLGLLPTVALASLSVATVFVSLGFGLMTHLYRGRFVTGSVDELRALALNVAGVTVTVGLVVFIWSNEFDLPRSIVLMTAPIFLIIAGGVRAFLRAQRVWRSAALGGDGFRTIVYGAGVAAETLVPQLISAPDAPYKPVAMLDDSAAKGNRWISGVPTLGNWDKLHEVAAEHSIEAVIVAIPSATSGLLQRVYDDCYSLGLRVVVLPSLRDYLGGRKSAAQLKEVGIEDLIGRQSTEMDLLMLREFLAGKSVLVTGAGGSIGSELVKQIAEFSPQTVVLVDRDETGLLMAETAAQREQPGASFERYLCDIRDASSVRSVFDKHRPDIVFHAAALKHLPMLEAFPSEAWKTNVLGTLNILTSARDIGVEILVNISTDKAADPVSTLGKSKKLAEEMTAWVAEQTGLKYVSVRFGNVIGSRGSLIPVLAEQIASNGPVTLTDKDATRYFMSIPEACQLVLQAAATGEPGDILVLDMGQPVKIQDVAERMIELSGKKIEIEYIGLRAGEKLHEALLSEEENALESSHPRILRLSGRPTSPTEVLRLEW